MDHPSGIPWAPTYNMLCEGYNHTQTLVYLQPQHLSVQPQINKKNFAGDTTGWFSPVDFLFFGKSGDLSSDFLVQLFDNIPVDSIHYNCAFYNSCTGCIDSGCNL
jgi:hypothetical protein